MKTLIKLEELLMVVLAAYLFSLLEDWWWFFALLLTPDISAVGYLLGPKVGAWTYNIAHHKGTAVAMLCIGTIMHAQWLLLAGLVMLGHSSLDRVFGYGLKYTDSFQHTHLGTIGRRRHGEGKSHSGG